MTPKLFSPQYTGPTTPTDSPSQSGPSHLDQFAPTTLYLWVTNFPPSDPTHFPYAITTKPFPIRINKAYSPMAHYTKVTYGTCRILSTIPISQVATTITETTTHLFNRGFPMHDQLGQLVSTPSTPTPSTPSTSGSPIPSTSPSNSPSNHSHPLTTTLNPLPSTLTHPMFADILDTLSQFPDPPSNNLLNIIKEQVDQRIATTTQNSKRVARYRSKMATNPYLDK